MDKKKLIPIILCIVFIAVAVFLVKKLKDNNIHFNELNTSYKGEVNNYKNLELGKRIIIGDYTFVISSIDKRNVVLKSIKDINGEVEFIASLKKELNICFNENDCALVLLK